MSITNFKSGISLVEAIIAIAIVGLISVSVATQGIFIRESKSQVSKLKAVYLLEEGMDAMRVIRDTGWNSYVAALSTTTDYRLAFFGGVWKATTTNVFIDNKFDRVARLSDVFRDGNQNISSSGAFDPKTKKLLITVSWKSGGATTSQMLSGYIFNTE